MPPEQNAGGFFVLGLPLFSSFLLIYMPVLLLMGNCKYGNFVFVKMMYFYHVTDGRSTTMMPVC